MLIYIKKSYPGIKFIIAGDFGQLKPVADRALFEYEKSQALYELCDGQKIELSVCRRADEDGKKLYAYYTWLLGHNTVKPDITFGKNQDTMFHIVRFNELRKKLNAKCMIEFIKMNPQARTTIIKALESDPQSQDMIVAKGMRVIARRNDVKREILNNEIFAVESVGDSSIVIKNECHTIEIENDSINKLLYPAYALTVWKCQGATIREPYTIHNWDEMDNTMRYVAISRATKICDISTF